MEGARIGAYRVEAELGSGAMGTVHRARVIEEVHGLEVSQRVALKLLHPHLLAQPGFFKRFLREAEVGRQVDHENVVRTFDVDALEVEGKTAHFLVMEYVEGRTLRQLGEELERVPEELCRHIGREVSAGLWAIHEAGVVHRDLKPENVLITSDHEVKIMDLGIALLADETIRLSMTGAFVGSPLYAAPEQFRVDGEAPDGRADLFALGVVLYELACGEHPHPGDDFASVLAHVLEARPRPLGERNPQVSAFFEEVVRTLLAKEPGKRFGSAEELADVLAKGERSSWWGRRAKQIRTETRRPLRRIRIPRETAVFGRDDELALLAEGFRQSAAGEGRVVVVEGEAGVGKSRLLDELIGRLRQDGEDLNFLFGSYAPCGAATASGAWSDAYREHFGAAGLAETLEEYLTVTPVLIPAFAALLRGEPTPPGEEPLAKDSIQTVFLHATRALAAERPTVVLIEDLHFAPEEGRALFASLALGAPGHRILLVGTARPGLPEDWRADLERLEHATRLELGRLEPRDVAALLGDAFRSERLAEELGTLILAKSDGNPFFVLEIIRGLREGKVITRSPDGRWTRSDVIRDLKVPSSVIDLIQARIADLAEDEKELLEVAACCGFEFDPGLVAEAAGVARIPALRRLARLERAHRMVRSVGSRFVFDHQQIQEALYAGLPAALAQEYHTAIGEALEARHPEPTGAAVVEICDHHLAGSRPERARPHIEAAIDHLRDGYQVERAVGLAKRALREPGLLEGAERCRLLTRQAHFYDFLGLGRAEEQIVSLERALALADASGDAELQSRVRCGLALWHRHAIRIEMAREEYALARALAQESENRQLETEARKGLGGISVDLGQYEEAREHYADWNAHARESGDLVSVGRSEVSLGRVSHLLGRHDDALRQLHRALETARESSDRMTEGGAWSHLGYVHLSLGRGREALECQRAALAVARQIGYRSIECQLHQSLGTLLLSLGQPERAREHLERSLGIVRESGERRYRSVETAKILGELGQFALAQNRPEEARESYEEALILWRDVGFQPSIATGLLHLGGQLHSEGRLDEAREHLEESLGLAQDSACGSVIVMAACQAALLPGGQVAAALALFDEHGDRLEHLERMEARFLLWQATQDPRLLEEAHRLLTFWRDNAPEEYRETMITNVPLHRDIMAAWEEHGEQA